MADDDQNQTLPCPDGDACPDARGYGAVHPAPSDSTAGPTEPEAPRLFGRPMEMFVKGGTHTSGHDRMMAERVADAERRRDEAAAERREAMHRGRVPSRR